MMRRELTSSEKEEGKGKQIGKKSRNNFCTNVMGYAPFSFFIPGNYFVNQHHSILELPEFCNRDSPSNVSTVENQTIKGSNMEREADLVKDMISTKYIHLFLYPNLRIVTNTKKTVIFELEVD